MSQKLMQLVEQSCLRPEVGNFEIGDTVDVHTKILEGNKERIQIFSGVVIARSGAGTREMFVVRRIVAGEGVERKFPLHSPRIEKVEVKRKSVVRRAKLYFLRDRSMNGGVPWLLRAEVYPSTMVRPQSTGSRNHLVRLERRWE